MSSDQPPVHLMPPPSCPFLPIASPILKHSKINKHPHPHLTPHRMQCLSVCLPMKTHQSDKDTKLSVHFKCSYYSKTLLLQRCLTIMIPIIIALGSTIIIPATTVFASVTIIHYAFLFCKCFLFLCHLSFTLGSDG